MKSSLSRKRVKTDPKFAVTMAYAGLLGKASKIASAFYRTLPKEQKIKGFYKQLTGKAMQWLKEGYDAAQVTLLLRDYCTPEAAVRKQEIVHRPPIAASYAFADAVIAGILSGYEEEPGTCLSTKMCCAPP